MSKTNKTSLMSCETRINGIVQLKMGESPRKISQNLGVPEATVDYWSRNQDALQNPDKYGKIISIAPCDCGNREGYKSSNRMKRERSRNKMDDGRKTDRVGPSEDGLAYIKKLGIKSQVQTKMEDYYKPKKKM